MTDWNGAHAQVKIQYDKWSEKFAEWIDVESYRLQPLGRFTQQTFQPVAGPVARGARGAGARPSGAAAASASSAGSSSAAATAASIAHFQASSSTEGRFRTLLSQKLGYDIVDQKEDGNCLFRSVSHQVYGDAAHHALVRESCMRYIEEEKGFFQNFIAGESFEQYIGRMKLDGEWGDNVELQAMSEIYERPIEIYAYSHRPLKTFMSSAATSGDGAAGPGPGAGARPPPVPIRLSYHFASHYNSVIHPQRHRAQCTTFPPGRLEAQALERAARMRQLQEQQRAAVAAAAASSSAAAATPEIPGSASLAQCRETFSSSQSRLAANPDGFEHAVAASLNELDRVLAEEIEQAQQASLREMEEAAMVEATCQQSEREQLEAQLAAATAATKDGDAAAATSSAAGGAGGKASKPTVEDEVLRQALAASLAAAPAGAVGALSEEEQIAQALRLSAAAAGGGAGQPSSSGLSAEEAAVQSAMRASMADSGVGGAASSGGDQLPPAVLACAELGFPLELCVQAYTLLANDADAALARTNSPQPDLVQRMMDYLCSG